MTPLPRDRKPSQLLPPPWDWLVPFGTRLAVWGLLFGILYLLRSFFLLIFFTFVFAYIQASGVKRLQRLVKNRSITVVLVASGLLCALILTGIFLVPKVKKQTEIFFSQFGLYIARVDQELLELSAKYPLFREVLVELKPERPPLAADNQPDSKNSLTIALLQQIAGLSGETDSLKSMNQMLDAITGLTGKIASIASAFLLALLFSFLIVLDLPRLSKSVAGLEQTKLKFIYLEAAANIRDFAHVLGRALEAQLLIAIVNSLLTASGLYGLGLSRNVAFLSVIVFFCSFIPVAGVFISSVPICLIALQTAGLQIMLLTIGLIIAIHLIEGYILNPRIYGSYLRINPVIVLMILTIAGKLFHFWGLILGVPICTYVFGHAIQNPKPTPRNQANKPEVR